MKPKDPIIAEIHRVRERIWKECHENAREFTLRQRKIQREYADRLIDVNEWKRRRKASTPKAG
jgi:hypothetical protein